MIRKKRIGKYTLPIFLERAREIHKNKFDYSEITKEHIKHNRSRIPVKCNSCDYKWEPTIFVHITSKRGCPDCNRWTLKKLLERAPLIYGDTVDFSLVKRENVKNRNSRIPLICNICSNKWKPTIASFMCKKIGCLECRGLTRWSYDLFLIKVKEIHDEKYEYSLIDPNKKFTCRTKLNVVCHCCDYQWEGSSITLIYFKHGCHNCAGIIPWTYEKFLVKAKEVLGDKYDYSQIKPEDIINNESKLSLKCNKCKLCWKTCLNDHVRGRGCRVCNMSCGYSKPALEWLKSIEIEENITIQSFISVEGEYKIKRPGGYNYKVDGYCKETNTVYEYNGYFWHGHPDKYNKDDYNPIVKKTFGELYQHTIEKENYIKSLGYNLVVLWGV